MAWFDEFLVDREPIGWQTTTGMPVGIKAGQIFLQAAPYGLEVAVAEAAKRPTSADMRTAWKARQGGHPSPLLLAVGYPNAEGISVAVCGPAGENPAVHFDIEPSRVERLAEAALAEPTRHAAQRCLLRLLPEMESELPGVINSGLLANQELRQGVPQRADWSSATKASQPALKKRGRGLVEALGFTVSHLGANTSLLLAGEDRRAVAVFLDEGETFDAPGARFENVSPVSHALAVAGREHLSWVVLTRAAEIRLYAARPDTGVGRRGASQTFIEVNLALLPDELAGYLHLLFSADALGDGGTFEQILANSADFAADLASRLRDRVYAEAVPALARAIAARLDRDPGEPELAAPTTRPSTSCSGSSSSPMARTRTFCLTTPTAATPTTASSTSPAGSPTMSTATSSCSRTRPPTCGRTSPSSGVRSTPATRPGACRHTTAACSQPIRELIQLVLRWRSCG
jgi:hypothetical protein